MGGASLDVEVKSELEPVSAFRLRETFVSASAGPFKDLKLPSFLQKSTSVSRDLLVTYLDDDLLIVRDELGTPEILMRQAMEFKAYSQTNEPDKFVGEEYD